MTLDPRSRRTDGLGGRLWGWRDRRRGAAVVIGCALALGVAGLAESGSLDLAWVIPRQALDFPIYLPLLARVADVHPPTPTRGPSPTPITPVASATPTATGTATVTPTPVPTDTPAVTATPTATPTELPAGPGIPRCAETRGDLGGFRFSLDDGVTMAPNARPLASLAYTWDLDVHPRDPDVIMELHEKTLFRSADAGCTFSQLATFDRVWTDIWRSSADPDLVVLTSFVTDAEPSVAWSEDGGGRWQTEYLPEDALGFAIDPKDPWVWSFVGRAPALYLRAGREARWEARAIRDPGIPTGDFLVNAAAAAPGQPGRWLVGTSGPGLLWTDDQGATWRAVGAELGGEVGSPPEPVLAVVVSWVTFAPSDADVAYAIVNRVGRQQSERGIWRTGDGGATWQRRVVDGQLVGDFRAELTGGTRVFVAPDDPDRAYFAFGSFYDDYGTDLFRSRDGLATLSAQHFEGFYKIFAMAWGPPGTDVLFAGTSRDTPR